MSHESKDAPAMNFARVGNTSFMLALLGVAAMVICAFVAKETFWSSYLFGYMFWISLTLGCLGLTTLHHTVRGSWGLSVLRLFEAGGGLTMFIVFAVAMVPILFGGMEGLYHHWVHIDPKDPVLVHKAPYLNVGGFIIRAAIYFILWGGFSWAYQRSSLKQDQTEDASMGSRRSSWGAVGIVTFVLSMTFAITDWVMSIDPHWFSTLFGFLFVIYSVLAALSLGTYIVTRYANHAPYNQIVTPALQKDLGNLLFTFTMFWGYFQLSQFLIIWSGNLPEFTGFFAVRNTGWLLYLGAFNIFFAFFLPWFLLLAPRTKKITKSLMLVAAWIFFMRILDWFWVVIPFFRPTVAMTDVVCWLAFGFIWFWIFGKQAAKYPLLRKHDERLVNAKLEAQHGHA